MEIMVCAFRVYFVLLVGKDGGMRYVARVDVYNTKKDPTNLFSEMPITRLTLRGPADTFFHQLHYRVELWMCKHNRRIKWPVTIFVNKAEIEILRAIRQRECLKYPTITFEEMKHAQDAALFMDCCFLRHPTDMGNIILRNLRKSAQS